MKTEATVTWSEGNITFDAGTWTHSGSGANAFRVQAAASMTGTGSLVVLSAGALNKMSAVTSKVNVVLHVNNGGQLNVDAGALELGGGAGVSQWSGAVEVGAPGALRFLGNSFILKAASALMGTGTVSVGGGQVTVETVATFAGSLDVWAGSIAFNSPQALASSVSVSGGTFDVNTAPTVLAGGLTVSSSGAVNVNNDTRVAGGLCSMSGGVLTVASGATLQTAVDCGISGAAAVSGAGAWNVVGGSVTLSAAGAVVGPAVTLNAPGVLSVSVASSMITFNSFLTVSSNALLTTSSSVTAAGGIDVSGVLLVTAGAATTFAVTAPTCSITGNVSVSVGQTLQLAAACTQSAGLVSGPGSLQILAPLSWSGTWSGLSVSVSGALTVIGFAEAVSCVVASSGPVTVADASVAFSGVTWQVSSSFTLSGASSVTAAFATNSMRVVAGGSLSKTGSGASSLSPLVLIDAAASLEVLGGTLKIGAGGSNLSGAVSVAADATLQFAAAEHFFLPSSFVVGTGNVLLLGSNATIVNLMTAVLMAAPSVWTVTEGELRLFSSSRFPVPINLNGGSLSGAASAGPSEISSLIVDSGTYTLGSATNVTGECQLSGGTLVVKTDLVLTNGCTQSGSAEMVISAGASVTSFGPFHFSGGSWRRGTGSGGSSFVHGAVLLVDGSVTISGVNMATYANVSVTSAISFSKNTSWTHAGGTLVLSGAADLSGSGQVSLGVAGALMEKRDAVSVVGVPVGLLTGTSVTVASGELVLSAGGSWAGAVDVAAGAKLSLTAGDFSATTSASLVGDGVVSVAGATVSWAAPLQLSESAQIQITNGNLSLTAAGSVSCAVSVRAGELVVGAATTFGGRLTVNETGSVRIESAVSLNGGMLVGGGSIVVSSAATTISGGVCDLSSGTVTVSSLAVLKVGASCSTGGGLLAGSGTLVVTGVLALNTPSAVVGPLVKVSGSGSVLVGGAGTVTFSGLVTVDAGATLSTSTSVVLSGGGGIDNSGLFLVGGSAASSAAIASGATCRLSGSVTVGSAQILTSAAACSQSGALNISGSFVSNGVYKASSGSLAGVGVATFTDQLMVQGAVTFSVGTVRKGAPRSLAHLC